MPKNQKTSDSNAVWGAKAIGAEVNKTAEEARYLIRIGAFGDAVKKFGHRTLVGDRRKLRQFPNNTSGDAA
jgi:hypothetical protein